MAVALCTWQLFDRSYQPLVSDQTVWRNPVARGAVYSVRLRQCVAVWHYVCIYGFAGLVDNLTKKISNKIGRNANIVGTGGGIDLVIKCCSNIEKKDKELTLKGLNFIYIGYKKS